MGGESKRKRQDGPRQGVLAVISLAILLVLGMVACSDLTATSTESTGTTVETPTTEAPVVTEAPTVSTAAANPVSQESRDYAAWLGGTSHQGEKLYFVIGVSVKSETKAKALLEPAKAVGDMQSNFIVQLSDNFAGMTPGYWVVFEAYDGYPSVEDLEFCRRPFPEAYVKTATVLTDDPIPVRPGG
jgi:hypothetical protein